MISQTLCLGSGAGHSLALPPNRSCCNLCRFRSLDSRCQLKNVAPLRVYALGGRQPGHALTTVLDAAQLRLLAAGAWSQQGLIAAVAVAPSSWAAAGAAAPTPAAAAAPLSLANLVTALQPSCFDAACQQEKDTLLVASLAGPLLVFLAVVAYLLRPPPQGSLDDGSLFEDSSTGTLFEAHQGMVPERDRQGELAFRAVSYTPWLVEEGAEGQRLRIDVGTAGQRQPRTFVFSKVLPQPSQLVVVTLDRPLGIVFEEDVRRKRVVVAGFTTGGHAEQQAKKARLNTELAATAALEGDVLRACTATNIVWQPGALAFGAQRPTRAIVVFSADGQGWPQVIAALQKGLVADGPVTLVLERRLPAEPVGSHQGSSSSA